MPNGRVKLKTLSALVCANFLMSLCLICGIILPQQVPMSRTKNFLCPLSNVQSYVTLASTNIQNQGFSIFTGPGILTNTNVQGQIFLSVQIFRAISLGQCSGPYPLTNVQGHVSWPMFKARSLVKMSRAMSLRQCPELGLYVREIFTGPISMSRVRSFNQYKCPGPGYFLEFRQPKMFD